MQYMEENNNTFAIFPILSSLQLWNLLDVPILVVCGEALRSILSKWQGFLKTKMLAWAVFSWNVHLRFGIHDRVYPIV